jgi:hypothetical protein
MQFATTEPKLTWQASPKQNPDSSLKIRSKKIRVKPYPVLLNEAVWQAEGRISRLAQGRLWLGRTAPARDSALLRASQPAHWTASNLSFTYVYTPKSWPDCRRAESPERCENRSNLVVRASRALRYFLPGRDATPRVYPVSNEWRIQLSFYS